jgi:regulator of RNase E activity RraA
MVVNHGDIVHADIHGAVTFKIEIAESVVECASRFIESEKDVLEACKRPENLSFEKLIKLYLSR